MKQTSFSRTPALPIATFVASVALVAAACSGSGSTSPNAPAALAIVAGDSQTITVGNRASAPLVARVTNAEGAGLPNVTVAWSIDSARGSIAPVASTTDDSGQARATYYSGATSGKVTVVASAGGHQAKYILTVASDTANGILSAAGGDGAAAQVGYPVTLTARAADRFGNPIPGVQVSWSASGGILQKATSTTDTSGKASTGLVVGPDTGKYTVNASSRFGPATFTVTAITGK